MNATSMAPPGLGINRLPRPFGDMPWPVPLGEAEERSVLEQARRHCPDWSDAPAGFEYRVAALTVSFVPSPYRLVRVSLHAEHDDDQHAHAALPVVYGFHAPGDFRPLDAEGRGIEELRRYAPIELVGDDEDATARAADYACMRLALEAAGEWRRFRAGGSGGLDGEGGSGESVGSGGSGRSGGEGRDVGDVGDVGGGLATAESKKLYRPAAVLSSPAMLPVDVERLDPTLREALTRAMHPPTVEVQTAKDAASDEDRLYTIEVGLCFADHGGVRVLRAVASLDREGAMTTDPAVWTGGGLIGDVAAAANAPVSAEAARSANAPDAAEAARSANAPVAANAALSATAALAASLRPAKALQRITPVLGIDEWVRVPVGGADMPRWVRQLVTDHGLPPETTVLRRARLPFYRTFELVEVLERRSPTSPYRRGYVLVRFDEEKARENLDIRALNGKSYTIHGVNDEPGELELDEETVEAYLRFFCWAVHGDHGPFLLPRSARELPFAGGRLKPKTSQLLETIDYRVRTSEGPNDPFAQYVPEDGSFAPRRAIVAYGGAVFVSWFEVAKDGTIRMLDDTPLMADVPIDAERYGQGTLIELRSWKRSSKRPEPRSSWQRDGEPMRGRPRRMLARGDATNANAWRELVAGGDDDTRVVVEDRDLMGALVFADREGGER